MVQKEKTRYGHNRDIVRDTAEKINMKENHNRKKPHNFDNNANNDSTR